jgi:hypothetical protein
MILKLLATVIAFTLNFSALAAQLAPLLALE